MYNLAEREGRIGCSQIAAVMGRSRYQSRLDVYNEIKGITVKEDNPAMQAGRIMEPAVIEMCSRFHDYKTLATNSFLRFSNDHRWLCGTPDAMFMKKGRESLSDRVYGLEVKCSSPFNKNWGREDSDVIIAVPEHYRIQCAGYMMLLDAEEWTIAVYLGGSDLRVWTIERNLMLEQEIIEKCSAFWENHLVPGVPPDLEPVFNPSEFIDSSKVCKASKAQETIYLEAMAHQAAYKDFKEQYDQAKATLELMCGDSEMIIDSDGAKLGYWTAEAKPHFDSATFRKDNADLYLKYCTKKSTRQFRLG